MVSATPKFIEGEKVVIDAVGGVDCVAATSSEIQLLRPNKIRHVYVHMYHFRFLLRAHLATQILVDGRSGAPVALYIH